MQTAELILFRLSGDHLHLPVKRRVPINIFASGMFTALSNGVVSAVLAFSRSFVFMLITMLILPAILGVNGIWLATPAAELMALALSAFMFVKYRKRYQY